LSYSYLRFVGLGGGGLLGRSLLRRGGLGFGLRSRSGLGRLGFGGFHAHILGSGGQATGAGVHLGLGQSLGLAVPLDLFAGAFDAGDAQHRFHLAMAVGAAIALTADLLEDLDLLALAGF